MAEIDEGSLEGQTAGRATPLSGERRANKSKALLPDDLDQLYDADED